MKSLKVDKDACIGCGACAASCEEVFKMNDEGFAEVTMSDIPESLIKDAIDAMENCPTGAIIDTKGSDKDKSE